MPIDLKKEAEQLEKYWSPKVLGQVNDQYVKVAKLKGELTWHKHDLEDELFLVLAGNLRIEYEDHFVDLAPGEFHVVPKGRMHNPTCESECLIALIETTTTQHTGEVIIDRTRSVASQLGESLERSWDRRSEMPAAERESFSINVSLVIAVIVGVLHYAVSGIPRQFEDVYDGFGAELPLITSFLIDSPFYFWIVPVLVVACMMLNHFGHIGRVATLLVSIFGTLASYVILMIGLYYPIFLLGGVSAG